jgi:crossover junction endodeoxyribonuclease RusA
MTTTAPHFPGRRTGGVAAVGDVYRLTYAARPWTLNRERAINRFERAPLVREWRQAFRILAFQAKIPPLDKVAVTVRLRLRAHGRPQDAGACFPAAKAAIDGLVDAGVLPEDNGRHVVSLLFPAPEIGAEIDELTLELEVVVR